MAKRLVPVAPSARRTGFAARRASREVRMDQPFSATPAPALARRRDRSWWHGDGAGKMGKRVDTVRKSHGVDEMLLEARLERSLDLFDPLNHCFDFVPCGGIEKGNAGAGTGGVAGGPDAF